MQPETAAPAQAARENASPAGEAAAGFSFRVGWVGDKPAWLDADEAQPALEGVELEQIAPEGSFSKPPDVVHVAMPALERLGDLRTALPDTALAVDLSGAGDAAVTWLASRPAAGADGIFVDSRWRLAELRRRFAQLPPRAAVVPRPLDLDWHAPEARLAETKGRGRDLRRFRRFHRLAAPMVLYAGPYTQSGGLDLLVEAVFELRRRVPELRLGAIPHGPTDPRYRDRCEMQALGLGYHGMIEWNPDHSEIPFWYATAAIVCCPSRSPVSHEPARRAAAAGRPFVGTGLEPFREHVDPDRTGKLLPLGDAGALDAALGELLVDEDHAARMGEAARRKAEAEYSPTAAAKALRTEWANLLEARSGSASRDGRVA